MKIPKRQEVDLKYQWNTTHIYNGDEAFEEAFCAIKTKLGTLEKYRGRLSDAEVLIEALRADEGISKELNKLALYAHMKKDEDTKLPKYDAMYQRVVALSVKFSSEGSYITPELSALPEDRLRTFIEDKRFSDFDYTLSEILRNKKHILSEKEERLMTEMHAFTSKFKEVFTMYDNADIRFDSVRTKEGEVIELSHGLYSVLLQSPDRETRRDAYTSMFSAYQRYINTIAAAYSGNVLKNVFSANVRNYQGALDRALSGENVDKAVYENLLESVNANAVNLQRYLGLRKNALKYDKLNFYDLHVPIVKNADMKLSYEEAYELVIRALAPLGSEYGELLREARQNGWIDVCETANKRSGAYSTDAYGVHPYVLLNYQRTTHDIFTVAHELGHAMHSHYSNANQPYSKAGYEIFVAEVASTVNEVLLLEYLLKSAKGDTKKFLLSYYLDMFRTTLFRQAMFAEFERAAHDTAKGDMPLNAESLSSIYSEINKRYYGEEHIVHDDLIACEWARIPHFYNAFYVYKYSTGIISAVSIADAILCEGTPAVERYKRFLSAGGSMSPVEILKLSGVDLTKKQPFERAMAVFKRTLDGIEPYYC